MNRISLIFLLDFYSPIKRIANTTEVLEYDNDSPFVTKKARSDRKNESLVSSSRQSKPTCSSPKPTRKTPRKKAVECDNKDQFRLNVIQEDKPEDDYNLPVQSPTPRTPRKKDTLSTKLPTTPRNRITIVGKQLFTPTSSRPPLTPGGSIITVYSQARQIFTKCSEPGRLVGRETEREKLSSFINDCLTKKTGGCIYVSGPPGTGKSALAGEVIDNITSSKVIHKICINCMSIRNSKDLYSHLLEAFCGDMTIYEGQEVDTLQTIFITRRTPRRFFIVTLDEIDRILTLDLEILYKLFEWALDKNSGLILLGVANALDLTDRLLPRLKVRDLRPQLLSILPYTAAQIKAIIEARLKLLMPKDSTSPEFVPFLHPAAIELCSRKVATQNGDLRKAFDICRRAISTIEAETKLKHEQAVNANSSMLSPSKRPIEEYSNLLSPQKTVFNKNLAESLASLTVETAPRASISHINKITSSIFGNGIVQRLKTLNLQQKAALCALIALEKRKREALADLTASPSKMKDASPTIKALYDVYCVLCTHDRILHPLTSIEFKDIIGSLETLSLVSTTDGRNGSCLGTTPVRGRGSKFITGTGESGEKRVRSCIGEVEVAEAIEGFGAYILKSILSGEGLG